MALAVVDSVLIFTINGPGLLSMVRLNLVPSFALNLADTCAGVRELVGWPFTASR